LGDPQTGETGAGSGESRLEVMVVLVTICGVLLLLAQVQVGMRQRHQELVVYRTLGAGKRLLRATLWCEFALLGLVAGLVAAIGAETALAVLQTRVFDFPWEPDWRLWFTLPICGAVLLSLCGGWLGIRLLKGKGAVPPVCELIPIRDDYAPVYILVRNHLVHK
jgi:putative ABC transport system permease protein